MGRLSLSKKGVVDMVAKAFRNMLNIKVKLKQQLSFFLQLVDHLLRDKWGVK
jgi:hypothetical protein